MKVMKILISEERFVKRGKNEKRRLLQFGVFANFFFLFRKRRKAL